MMTNWPSLKYKPASGEIPHAPGVYRFFQGDTVVYVGKAKHLDSRLANYFVDPARLHPRTRKMVETANRVVWVVTSSEREALVLEQTWIHQYRPRFNVAMKNSDSKYPSLALTDEEVPRLMTWRGERKAGPDYFGPYPAVNSRELFDALLKVFPVRSCNAQVFKQAQKTNRPCLLASIGKCSAPCVGRITPEEHKSKTQQLAGFLRGDHQKTINALTQEMTEAAEVMDFEKAARRRDEIAALTKTFEKVGIVLETNLNVDAVAVREKETDNRIGVAQAVVRKGQLISVRTWTSEKDPLLSQEEQFEQILGNLYSASDDLPQVLLLEEKNFKSEAIAEIFTAHNMVFRAQTPRSGSKLEVLAYATRNAQSALDSNISHRPNSIEDRTAALEEISQLLGVGLVPWRIECIDVAHISGTLPVASVVVFEDGVPNLKQYRRLNLSDDLGGDDFEGVKEALRKRFGATQAGMSRRPDLMVIDGGPGQVAAALEVFQELEIKDVMLCGLAKRLEEVWVPGDDMPLILGRESKGLLLLQHLRDEAHRVANTTHRKRREKKALVSALDEVSGLGEEKRKNLMESFGTIGAVMSASEIDLSQVRGIGPKLAKKIWESLHP